MAGDKKTALWLSYSSISDYLRCPRCYFLKSVYRDKATGKKIKVVSPALSLGQAVHEVLEGLSKLRVEDRFAKPLFSNFELVWTKVSGRTGGFFSEEVEQAFKARGLAMLSLVTKNPDPLKKLAVKMSTDLPHYFLSEADNIVLCGKVEWLQYFPETDSVHIIDFKTSRFSEGPGSLQLPIYHLLVKNCQNRAIRGASYWYLESSDTPEERILPDVEESARRVLKIAKEIKLARTLEKLVCSDGSAGCNYCQPYEDVLAGKAERVKSDERYDYYAFNTSSLEPFDSEVL